MDDPGSTTGPVRAGFIGLGSQGGPMARRIAEEGHTLTLWARRPASLEPFAATPAQTAPSPSALAAASDVVCVCVYEDADVLAVVDGDDGVLAGAAPGTVLCVHSTVHPRTIRRVEALAAARGVSVLDAPVSGGGTAAEERRLVVMVGGDPEAFAIAEPVLTTFGNPVRLLGPLGAGTLVKLINNMLMTALLGVSEDALALAARLGADRQAVAEVISSASGGSLAMRSLSYFGGLEGFAAAEGGPLLAKDARILREVVAAAGADDAFTGLLPAAERALRAFTEKADR